MIRLHHKFSTLHCEAGPTLAQMHTHLPSSYSLLVFSHCRRAFDIEICMTDGPGETVTGFKLYSCAVFNKKIGLFMDAVCKRFVRAVLR
jgi:hypothetical protein